MHFCALSVVSHGVCVQKVTTALVESAVLFIGAFEARFSV